jgi:hypothetical protein
MYIDIIVSNLLWELSVRFPQPCGCATKKLKRAKLVGPAGQLPENWRESLVDGVAWRSCELPL